MIRAMKDSGIEWIGEIPHTWEVKRHKYVMYKIKEICPKYNGENIISLTMNGVIIRDLDNPKGKMPVTFDGYQKVYCGNLLLCLFDIDVTPRCVGLIQNDGLTSPAYSQFVIKDDNSAKYYDYLLRMIDDKKAFLHLSKNLRSSLTETDFGLIKTIVPSLTEQAKIAEFLDEKCKEIDNIIENTKVTIEEYKKYKYAIVADVVTKGLSSNVVFKNSGVDWMGSIPKSWDVIKLKFLFSIKKVIANKLGYDILSVTQSGLKIKDISNNEGQISSDYSKYQIVEPKDFVMNHMDLLTGWVDCSSFLGVTSPDYRVFKLDDESKALREYFLYIFQLCYKHRIFYGLGQGVSNMGRWRLQTDKFINFEVPLPSIEEQKEIVEFLDIKCSEIDTLISKKQHIVKELESYKKSLIYECVTGKVEV